MKRIIFLVLLLLLSYGISQAVPTMYVESTDTILMSGRGISSAGSYTENCDTVHVIVIYQTGSEKFDSLLVADVSEGVITVNSAVILHTPYSRVCGACSSGWYELSIDFYDHVYKESNWKREKFYIGANLIETIEDDVEGGVTLVDSSAGDLSDIANHKTGVLVDSVSDNTKTYLAHVNYDTMLIHASDFKATGFSTFDHTSDAVTLVDSSAGDISDIANHKTGVLIDSISDATKSYLAHVNYDTMLIHASDFKESAAVPDSTLGDISDMANHKTGVLIDSVSDNTKSFLAHVNYDSMLIHASDFQSDGDTNTFDLDDVGDVVWDEAYAGHTGAGSFGLALGTVHSTIVVRVEQCGDAGSANTIDLDAAASSETDYYKGQLIALVLGTGAGQSRTCISYDGATNIATVSPNWATNPDGNTYFAILNTGSTVPVTLALTTTDIANAVWNRDSTAYAHVDSAGILGHALAFAGGGSSVWTTTQRDSVLNTILDANKVNYMRWTVAQRDSVLNTILDANKTNYMATGFATSSDFDSVNNAIADANKENFMATGFSTSSDFDSVNNAIADANKGNFKADVDSMNNAVADANKSNFKATGFATDADGDSIIQAIADANKVNFMATGFATSTQGDSVTQAIADANKVNFQATIPDSSRAYLATHDSTLLEQAASAGASKITGMDAAVYDTIAHNVYDTMQTHADDFKYSGAADSVRAYLATHDSTLLEQAAQCSYEDTIWIIQTDTGSVPTPNLTKVKGFTRTYGFQKTDRVTVTFATHETNLRDTTTGAFIDKIEEKVYADTGYFEIDLIASPNLISDVRDAVKDSIRYDVTLSAPGRTIFERTGVLVPISASPVWLKDILDY